MPPNPEMPEYIRRDYQEAQTIVTASPRGAAALLRLCIQKLCLSLGKKGENIDDDIASLVSKGLSPTIQVSLDVVRVIGNEAVHPGKLDIKDDTGTVVKLFDLVNLIADEMIAKPKKINALYEQLPESKGKAIDERNKKARKEIN